MPEQSPRDYSNVKRVRRLTQGSEGRTYIPGRGGINPATGKFVRKGSLTQKPKGTFLENVKTPGKQSTAPKEMLTDRQIKSMLKPGEKGKKPGVLTKIKAKIYALQGKTPKGNPTRNIGPLFKTDSTKGKIPKTRQVRPSTISPVTGKKIKRVGRYGGSGGGLRIGGRRGFGER